MPKFDAAVGLLLEQAGDLLTSDKSFVYPNIPEKKLKNALTSIAKGVSEDEVLLLVDATIFGSAKDGVIVTADKIYLKEAFTDPKIFRLRQVEKITFRESQVYINGEEAFSTAGISDEEAAALVKLVRAYCDPLRTEQSPSSPSLADPQPAVSSKKVTKQIAGQLVEIGVDSSGEPAAAKLRSDSKRLLGSPSTSSGSVPGWGHIAAVSAEMSAPDSDGDSSIELSLKVCINDPAAISGFMLSAEIYQNSKDGIDILKGFVTASRVYEPDELPSELDLTEWIGLRCDPNDGALRVDVRLIGFKCDWLIAEAPIAIDQIRMPGRGLQDPLGRVTLRGFNVVCSAAEDDAKLEIRGTIENQKTTQLPLVAFNVRALDAEANVAFDEWIVVEGMYSKRRAFVNTYGYMSVADIDDSSKVVLRVGVANSVLDPLDSSASVTLRQDYDSESPKETDDETSDSAVPTDTYFVRFPLTKGNGDLPGMTELSATEKNDIRECCVFTLDWDTDASEGVDDVTVTEVAIIYDGVTPLEERDDGLRVEGESIDGHPAPVIWFKLNREVDKTDLIRMIWGSSVRLWPSSRANDDAEPFYYEDHNGYISALGGAEVEAIMDSVHDSGLKYRNDISFKELREGIPIKLMMK
jgi:hypothetical protein